MEENLERVMKIVGNYVTVTDSKRDPFVEGLNPGTKLSNITALVKVVEKECPICKKTDRLRLRVLEWRPTDSVIDKDIPLLVAVHGWESPRGALSYRTSNLVHLKIGHYHYKNHGLYLYPVNPDAKYRMLNTRRDYNSELWTFVLDKVEHNNGEYSTSGAVGIQELDFHSKVFWVENIRSSEHSNVMGIETCVKTHYKCESNENRSSSIEG